MKTYLSSTFFFLISISSVCCCWLRFSNQHNSIALSYKLLQVQTKTKKKSCKSKTENRKIHFVEIFFIRNCIELMKLKSRRQLQLLAITYTHRIASHLFITLFYFTFMLLLLIFIVVVAQLCIELSPDVVVQVIALHIGCTLGN